MDTFYVGIADTAKRARPHRRSMQEEKGSDDEDDSRKRSRDEDEDFQDPDSEFNGPEDSEDDEEPSRQRNNRRSKRQRRAEPREKEERIRPSAQDEDGPSTSGPPPDFQLAGLDGRRNRDLEAREGRYRTDNWEDTTSESPEVEEQNPGGPEEEEDLHGAEDDDDRASSSSGSTTSSTSLPEYQRGFIGPLRDPQRAGLPIDAMLPAADERLGEERPEPNEEGPEDLEEDQGRAASPAPQEEEANREVEDQGLQPLEWLEQYRGAQLFEGHPPFQEHARIREDDVPVLQQEMPRELVELHQEEDILLARLAHEEEMPRLHPDDLDLLEDNLPHQVHYGVHQDHGALIPQDRYEIFEDNVPVHHQEMPRELDELHQGEELLLPQGALGAEVPQLHPADLDLLEDNLPHQVHYGVHQDHGALNPQDQFEIFEDNELVRQAEDVLQEGGVRWPGEVSLHKYLSEKSLNFGPRHSLYATAQVFLREMDFTQTTRNNWYSQHERLVLENKLRVLLGASLRVVKREASTKKKKAEGQPVAKEPRRALQFGGYG